MQKIDANVILRYILNDHPVLSPKSREIIDQNIVEVPVEVLFEVVYVLTGHYKIDRLSVCIGLKHFFEHTKCMLLNRSSILQGLEYYRKNTLDFIDCVLAGYATVENDEIFTFDDKLKKLITRIKTKQK
jgi:predicted nucleic-acid-binding protein